MIDDRRVERLRPGQNALGERFGFGDDPPEWPTGVGTAASVREWGLERPAIATACRPYMRMPRRRMFLTLRTEVASTSVLNAVTLAAGRITGASPTA